MDKVRRFSKALHPKHWRQSKAEPEPLPHPSAMGLMALAARPLEGQRNDYEAQSSSFIQNKSEVLEADNDDEGKKTQRILKSYLKPLYTFLINVVFLKFCIIINFNEMFP